MTNKPQFVGERVKLGDVLQIVNGKNQKAVEDENGQYPIYGSGGQMGWASSYICPANTVIIGRKGNINKPIYVSEPFWNVDTAFGLVAKPEVLDARYLYHFCKHYDFEKLNTTCTIPSLTRKNIEGILLRLPSFEKQEEMTARFDSILKQITLAQRQLSNLDSLVKSRFVEMFGDPDSNSHGLEVCPLGKVLSVQPSNGLYKPQKDYVSDGSGTPIIRIDSFRNEGPDYSSLKRLNCNESECRRYGINENDIVINRVNSVGCMGKTMLVSHIPEVTVFESNMMRLHSDETLMIPAFLCAQMTSEFSKSYFEANAKRAIGQASINQKDVKGLPVLVPTIGNQKTYLSFVSQVDKSRFVAQQQIEKLQMLYDSLAQEYFGD